MVLVVSTVNTVNHHVQVSEGECFCIQHDETIWQLCIVNITVVYNDTASLWVSKAEIHDGIHGDPIIFTGTEGERDGIENVGISGTYKAFLRLYCGRLDSPSSYGRYSARVDKPASFDSDVVLQHGYIEDEAGTNVTLTFTRY